MRISERLRVISDFIPDNSFILDIGCDHALLDIYTVLNKKNIKSIASDINEGPLKGAKENIKKYNLENEIHLVLGDGFSSYKKGVDTVILSGLGSTTIIDILQKGKDCLDSVDRLIISSNNDYYYLRKSICDLGFYIKDEKIVYEKDKYYPIIVFLKGKEKYSDFELKYGPVLLKEKNKTYKNYLKFQRKKLMKIYKELKLKHVLKKIKIKKEIKRINMFL